jgi:hypothetical protein
MDTDITFGIHKKYTTDPGSPYANNYIDAMTSPLVGDLNGDGKPEIVIMGNYDDEATTVYKYINIYNGQTGERLIRRFGNYGNDNNVGRT